MFLTFTRHGQQAFAHKIQRLDPELRKAMEEAQRQDGDESLAAWNKRMVKKELKQKGIAV
ncbi:hypothetical protein AM348_03745 [Citrobacter freundii]|nr:hypothetical protein AM348_03745 [Citrobacter freundii]AVD77190.1 hypothetical protein AM350_05565 [Citrobacter freundii]